MAEVEVKAKKVEKISFDDLEGLIQKLETDIGSALDVESAQAKFDELVNELKAKEAKLKETLSQIANSKQSLEEEIRNKEHEEQSLIMAVNELKGQKAQLEANIQGHENGIAGLRAEKEELGSLVTNMKDVLVDLKSKVSEFNTGLNY